MRYVLDLDAIAEKASQVKKAFRDKGVDIVVNISFDDMKQLFKSQQDPEAAVHEVEEQTRKVIENLKKTNVNFDANGFAKEVLKPYRVALDNDVVFDVWTREQFNETFGVQINDKNWRRWVNGNEGKGYQPHETRHLEKAYAQFVIGF